MFSSVIRKRRFQKFSFWNCLFGFTGKTGLLADLSKGQSKTNRALVLPRKIIILFIASCTLFSSCKTMGAAAPDTETMKYRDILEQVQDQHVDIAITGVKIETESRGIVEDIKELEEDMVSVPEGSLWLPQVQELHDRAAGLQEEAEKMNIQLEVERKTNGMLTEEFNAFEAAHYKAVSERDTEITILKIENSKVKGQRNTLFAIVITAVLVIVLYLVFTILKRLKIIPF